MKAIYTYWQHSEFIVWEEKKYCFMYELPLKTSQKPNAVERTGKRYISYVRLFYVKLGLLE